MLNKVFGQFLEFVTAGVRGLGLAALICLPALATAQQEARIGHLQNVVGQAQVVAADGAARAAEKGAVIVVGDRIVTSRNGHVHVRFVDEALVSVRPNSELIIERYDYNPGQPNLSAVKFSLTEGVARSISGEAARNARERFRLNTPIAAIGVRGTDFIVSTNAQTTQAQVKEGVIVLAPYSPECSMDALGPCMANALELEGNTLQMLELNDGVPLPRLMPAQNIRNPGMMRSEVQVAMRESGAPGAPAEAAGVDDQAAQASEVIFEGVTSQRVTADAETAASEANSGFVPRRPLSDAELTSRQLVWGRYSDALGNRERITTDFSVASAERNTTVGNLNYGLFRPEQGSKRVEAGLGVVSFNLASAQAFYNSATGIVAMDVSGGSLSVDFTENRFATSLDLSHALTGDVDFIASGRVRDGGYFFDYGDNKSIIGAVSLDGREAGYFFEQQLEAGGIQGLTLWDSR